jgi:hypothetical protein
MPSKYSTMISVTLSAAGALAARWFLAISAGDLLASRIEISNAFNSMRGIREGLALMDFEMSPYAGMVAPTAPRVLLILWMPCHKRAELNEAIAYPAYFAPFSGYDDIA